MFDSFYKKITTNLCLKLFRRNNGFNKYPQNYIPYLL